MAQYITCKGKVQGVFFRASTKEVADQLGVVGRVRNEPNGDVTIHAEGETLAIEKLIEWCRKGPMLSQVSEVSSSEVDDLSPTDFRIRY